MSASTWDRSGIKVKSIIGSVGEITGVGGCDLLMVRIIDLYQIISDTVYESAA